MHKARWLFTITTLGVAFSILGVSLWSGTTKVHSADSNLISHKQFYLSASILPDHIAYPLLMAVDRIELESAAPIERIYLQTEYANRRLGYAQKLLEKGNTQQAVTTITKAQKYLLSAAHEALELDPTQTNPRRHVLDTLTFHIEETKSMADEFDDTQRVSISQLNNECEAIKMQLKSSLDETLAKSSSPEDTL